MNDSIVSLCVAVVAICLIVGVTSCTTKMNADNARAVSTICGGDLTDLARAIACHRLTGRY